MARILIVLRILWTAGAQRIAINEYKWLKKLGHDPKIIFLRATKTKGYEELLKDVDYRVIRYGNGILTPLFYLPTKLFSPDRGIESTIDLDLILKLPKIIKEEEANYLICHDQFAGIGCHQAYIKLGVPYSVFIHEKLVNYSKPILGNIINNLERKVLSNAKRVFAVTDKVARTVYEKHKIKAIPNYPGMDKISETPFSRRENVLLAVSFWDYGRRPWDYLEVIKNIDNYKLLIVGNWRVKEAKENTIRRIKEENLDEKIELMEGVPETKLNELYDRSKFVIRFGYSEYGLATAIIESIQHTTPVIINDELGTAELVNKYKLGLVIHGLNYNEIKNFVNKVNEEEYTNLQKNINIVQKEYSWENHTKKIIES
ncbi:glycosyltransferase family 4 protein [Acidianus sp. HS-5]|uniref:glycosyltransferase family 4 protein n=1 Tax=Acidianus sp. HS-5 TaxID=2886040 RepID=UPI001F3599F5|nr:glycosyltransferase family 4 protein [Acidianus sp. HS-5]BDC17391.1 glycosyl transferase [Acidianus sp. HS-5]